MKNNVMNILIIYASETGNSEYYSKELYRKIKSNFQCHLKSANDVPTAEILQSYEYIFFVVSTIGQGDEPRSLKKLWKSLLHKSLPLKIFLNGVRIAVLGLGDSSYQRFNFCAKKLYRRLMQLGATDFLPLCLANEQDINGSDTICIPWIDSVYSELIKLIPSQFTIDPTTQTYCISSEKEICFYQFPCLLEGISEYSVSQNQTITFKNHFQTINEIKFTSDTRIVYNPGDILEILPQNNSLLVDDMMLLFSHLNSSKLWDISDEFGFKLNGISFLWLSKYYFDLNGVPRQFFFRYLSEISFHEQERQKLVELGSSSHLEEYYDYCTRPHRNYIEVLLDFPNTSSKLSLFDLVSIIPRMKPREYSIASSFSPNYNEIAIIVSLIKYQTIIRTPRIGLASSHLLSLNINERIYGRIKSSCLAFPKGNQIGIFIATGTGCASFHSYIEYIQNNNIKPDLPHLLFIGFRNKDKDYIYGEDWEHFAKIRLFTAFSRDQTDKIYVQHRIRNQASIVYQYIMHGAFIYISGNAKFMPDCVYDTFTEILMNCGQMNRESAVDYLSYLKASGHYQTEVY